MPSKSSSAGAPGKGSQSFPYDHLFKLLMIGDAGVGKVRLFSATAAAVCNNLRRLFKICITNTILTNDIAIVTQSPQC